MLQQLAPNLWHIEHQFNVLGMPLTSRMSIVRMQDGRLFLHSPIPITPALAQQLNALGPVAYIIAPSKMHHLFARSASQAFPDAQLLGAPGLKEKRADLSNLREIPQPLPSDLAAEFKMECLRSIPFGNETVWLHQPSKTLILTDLCQWWQGDLTWNAAFYAWLTGVRHQLVVPRSVRLMVKDKAACRASCETILGWDFERLIVAHNCILEQGAHAALANAFAVLR